MTRRIGPDMCFACGSMYGHTSECPYVKADEARERKARRALGTELLAAIKAGKAETIGRLIREARSQKDSPDAP